MKQDKFYKTSSHGGCGSTVMFWAVDGKGYLSNLDEAHIYTKAEIMKDAVEGRFAWKMIPLSVSHVNDLATWRVDCQYVSEDDHYPNKLDPNDEYVSIHRNQWDGNDLPFGGKFGNSFDYAEAVAFSKEDIDPYIDAKNPNLYFIPKTITDQLARRTFQTNNINRRKMIQGAGIVGVRKQRESRDSGKTRCNCPTCGKIVWQYNPYDFDSCCDPLCDSYDAYMRAC
jgi:hypothetical protein